MKTKMAEVFKVLKLKAKKVNFYNWMVNTRDFVSITRGK